MKTLTCCSCNYEFCLSDELYEKCLQDGRVFYCPVGHPQRFADSENAKLKKRVAELEKTAAFWEEQFGWLHDAFKSLESERNHWRGQATGYKGQWIKLRNQMQADEALQ